MTEQEVCLNLKNSQMIELIVLSFIEAEVVWDWYHEVKKKQSPNYAGSNVLRMAVLSGIWITSPWLRSHMTIDQWWAIPPMAMLCFWFLFDWHLNLARTWSGRPRPYWYLGENSKLDKWQRANGGAFTWFWIKMVLAVTSVIVFEIGIFDIINFISNLFK